MRNLVCLYIAIHNKTGLRYFGKTTKYFTEYDLQKKYHGSGIYWKKHLIKYGDDVTMTIYKVCDINDVEEIALKFSIENNIVKSKKWANLIFETGIQNPEGFIIVYDKIKRISKTITIDEYYENKNRYHFHSTGKFLVYDKNENKYLMIDKKKYNQEKHLTTTKNKIIVYDEFGNTKLISKIEFNKDKFVSINFGKVVVFDEVLKLFKRVNISDKSKYNKFPNTGKVVVKDKKTKKFKTISMEDFTKDNYDTPSTNMVNVINIENGKKDRITKEEYKNNKNLYQSLSVGNNNKKGKNKKIQDLKKYDIYHITEGLKYSCLTYNQLKLHSRRLFYNATKEKPLGSNKIGERILEKSGKGYLKGCYAIINTHDDL